MPYRLIEIDKWLAAREAQRRPDDELLEVVTILTDYAAGGMSAPNGFWIAHCVERLTGCRSVPMQVDGLSEAEGVKSLSLVRVT